MKRIQHNIELKHISAETKEEIFELCLKAERSAHAVKKLEGYEIFIPNVTKEFHAQILEILQK